MNSRAAGERADLRLASGGMDGAAQTGGLANSTAAGLAGCGPRAGRRDAIRNYYRILDAAREVLGESGADAGMEEIAARAGVGVGTLYRRFASKDALIDELLRLSVAETLAAAGQALSRVDGHGLEELLRALGALFAGHARYAHLLLQRRTHAAASCEIRSAIKELTLRALAAGTLSPDVTVADVMAVIWAMRGLVEAADEAPLDSWQRFLDIHLAGLRPPAHTDK